MHRKDDSAWKMRIMSNLQVGELRFIFGDRLIGN